MAPAPKAHVASSIAMKSNEFMKDKIDVVQGKHPDLFIFPDVTLDLVDWDEVNCLIAQTESKVAKEVNAVGFKTRGGWDDPFLS